MTDKKVIENLEKYIDLILNKNYCDCNELNVISNGGYCDGSKNVAVSIQTLINRITELEKIEETHRELNGELRKELQLKDKMIDLMASDLYDYASLEVIIECPAEYDGKYNMDLCKMNVTNRNCLKCIKEYFTKKASEENG